MAREYFGDIIGCILANGEQIALNEKDVKVVITQPRNIRYHKHIFNVLGYTLKYMKPVKGINSTRRLLLFYKDYADMYESLGRRNGREIVDYDSISFSAMDQKQFEEVANDIHEFCSILLAHQSQEVMNGLIQLMLF